MARIVNSTFAPIVECVIRTHFEDGTTDDKILSTDEVVEDFRYVENGEIKVVTGRVAEICMSPTGAVRKYTTVSKLKSYFRYDNPVTHIVIDKSLPNQSDVVKVPVSQIIEDVPVENVTKIEVFAKYGATIKTLLSDGTVNEMTFHEGDALDDIVILAKGGDKTIDALLVAMTYDKKTYMPKAMYTVCEGEIMMIDVMRIKSVGQSTPPLDTTGSITEAIKEAPGNIFLTDGEFHQEVDIENNIVINGCRAGIPATSASRDHVNLTGETIISGKINVKSDSKVSLDGVALTKEALLSLGDAEQVELKNCIVKGLEPTKEKTMGITMTPGSPITLVIKGCYFGECKSNSLCSIYNLLEGDGCFQPGSEIAENYFEASAVSHNTVNIYDIEDDTVLTIHDNTWENSYNGIRIGIKGNKKCTINVYSNTYLATDKNPDYAPLVLVQPYLQQTESMKDITINIKKTTHRDSYPTYYLYSGPNDMDFTKDNVPTIYVDGKKQDLSKYYAK